MCKSDYMSRYESEYGYKRFKLIIYMGVYLYLLAMIGILSIGITKNYLITSDIEVSIVIGFEALATYMFVFCFGIIDDELRLILLWLLLF